MIYRTHNAPAHLVEAALQDLDALTCVPLLALLQRVPVRDHLRHTLNVQVAAALLVSANPDQPSLIIDDSSLGGARWRHDAVLRGNACPAQKCRLSFCAKLLMNMAAVPANKLHSDSGLAINPFTHLSINRHKTARLVPVPASSLSISVPGFASLSSLL